MDRYAQLYDSLLTPLPKEGMADALMDDPFERAAYRTRQGAKPTGGRQEGPFTEALSNPSTLGSVFRMTPPGMMLDMYESGRRGDMGGMAMDAAGSLAGPLLKAAGGVASAAPRMTAGALGAMGAMTAADAGERNPKTQEWWRTARDPAPTIDPFVAPSLAPEDEARFTAPQIQGFDKLGPMGKLKATEQRNAMQAKLLADREAALRDKTTSSRSDYDASVQQKQAAYEAEQARLDAEDQKFRTENQSFREAHPTLAPALEYAGSATAAGFPLLARGFRMRGNKTMVGQLNDAIAGGDAAMMMPRDAMGSPMRAGAARRLESAIGPQGIGRMRDTELPLSKQAAWAAAGGVEGALGSEIPYTIDYGTLPAGSHGREESGEPGNWGMQALAGAIPGAIAGAMGARVPMGMGGVPDIARAEGLIKGLTSTAGKNAGRSKPSVATSASDTSPAQKPKSRTRKKPEPVENE